MSKQLKDRLKAMGLTLPPAPKPAGVYRPILVIDNQLYVSGQGPVLEDGTLMVGKVGSDVGKEEGKLAARQVGLTMLSTIITHTPDELIIKRVVKVLGMVLSLIHI